MPKMLPIPRLRDRVVQLERELANAQKFAGIPAHNRLPAEKSFENGNLSPPELLKQPPVRSKTLLSVCLGQANFGLGNSRIFYQFEKGGPFGGGKDFVKSFFYVFRLVGCCLAAQLVGGTLHKSFSTTLQITL